MAGYVLPEFLQDKQDFLWVNLIAKEFKSQSAYARGKGSIQTGEQLGSWKIIAPEEIQENINHEWSEYESIATRIAQKVGQVRTAIREAKGLGKAAMSSITEAKEQAGSGSFSARDIMAKGVGSAIGVSVGQYKTDSSMVYQNSQRREYSLTFNLGLFPGDVSSQSVIFEPIRELEKLSCPVVRGDLISIEFPAIFKIFTTPSNIININHAALTSVQPTWKYPFKNGFPTNCELTLTFMDLEPLYRKSFEEGGIIRTS